MQQASRWIVGCVLSANIGLGIGTLALPARAEGFLPGASAEQTAPAFPTNPEEHARFRQKHQDRQVVAPGMGMAAPKEPGRFSRMMTSMKESKVARKVTSVFKSDPPARSIAPVGAPVQRLTAAESAKESKPMGADFYVSLARAQEKVNKPAAAAELYGKALEVEPGNLNALLGYGRLHDTQGNLPEATRYYQKAVDKHPQSAAAFNDLGLCYARQNQLDKSVAALSQAIKLQPDRKLYRNNIATVLIERGQPEAAYQHLAVAHSPAAAHYNVGYLLAQRNENAAASEQFSRALAKDPSLTDARKWMNVLAQRQQQGIPATQARGSSPAPVQSATPVIEKSAPWQRPARSATSPLPESLEFDSPTSESSNAQSLEQHEDYRAGRDATAPTPPTPDTVDQYPTDVSPLELNAPGVSPAARGRSTYIPPSRY